MNRTVIALGFFDGVHRGHGALLEMTVRRARELDAVPAAFTFDRPPKEVVTGRPVGLINTSEDRRDLMQRLYGIRQVIIAPFDNAMMTMPWQEFIDRLLVGTYGAVHLVAGHDYHFGHRNQGDPQKLQARCRELGIGCDIIPQVTLDGITVSSTYIRSLLREGDMLRAEYFMGHPHFLTDVVRHGHRLGHHLGAPTVNMQFAPGVLVPPHGVYAARALLPEGEFPAVTNIGVRPTVSSEPVVTVESHLLGFDGNLYGRTLALEFFDFLRPERRFADLDELGAQIARDGERARQIVEARR